MVLGSFTMNLKNTEIVVGEIRGEECTKFISNIYGDPRKSSRYANGLIHKEQRIMCRKNK